MTLTPWRLMLPLAIAFAIVLGCVIAFAQGGGNLLANPGAEEGSDPPPAEGQPQPPHGWAATGEFTVGDYGAPDLPSAAHSQAIAGGTRFFHGGRCPTPPFCDASSAQQEFDVSASGGAIDAGSVRAEISAAIGGRGAEIDAGRVLLQFYGAASERLGEVQLGPVTAAERGNQTALLPRSAERVVPSGTRRLRVALLATGGDGERIDAYFDNVSLRLAGASAPPQNVTPPPPGGGGGGGGTGGDGTPGTPPVTLSSRPVRMTSAGTIRVRARCNRSDAPCAGRLTLASGRRACASRAATVQAGRARQLTLRLRAACRRLVVRNRRGLSARVVFRAGSSEVGVPLVVRPPAR